MDFARPGASFGSDIESGCLSHRSAQPEVVVSGLAQVLHSVLSPGVRVEEDASVEDSVLLPGAHIGPGARVRRAIIEEGVHIPAGFQAGWDIEHDGKHFTVSANGVVVVRETPKIFKPVLPSSTLERTVVGLKPVMRQKARHAA